MYAANYARVLYCSLRDVILHQKDEYFVDGDVVDVEVEEDKDEEAIGCAIFLPMKVIFIED